MAYKALATLLALRPIALRAAVSSAQIPLARPTRLYSTESANPSPSTPAQNVHQVQARPRTRTLRKVGEASGSTAQLVALAVQKTQARGGDSRRTQGAERAAQATQGRVEGQQRSPRQMQRTPEEHREWLKQRLNARNAGGEAFPRRRDLPSRENGEGGDRRRYNGQRTGEAGGAPRRPRGDRSASGAGGGARAAFQRPQVRRTPRPSVAGPQWPVEATRPLTPPSTVRYPSAHLAQLLRADLANKAVQLKCVLGGDKVVNEDDNSREKREEAKKILGGDYSMWLDAGKVDGKKNGVVEHARGILKANPSVALSERQVLLNKIREAVL